MAIQQYAYAFPNYAAESDSSSGLSLYDLNRRGRSCCRDQPRKKSIVTFPTDKDQAFMENQPFITRSSATGQVTISVSLVGGKKSRKQGSQHKKKTLLLPPIQNNQAAKNKRCHIRKRVTFRKKKQVGSIGTFLPKIPSHEDRTKGIQKRSFTIHYFPQETIEIKVERDIYNRLSATRGLTYARLKHNIALTLRIEPTSLNFFGIFLGPLGNPKELCMDDATIPDKVEEVCFQRLLLVSEEEERYYLSKDDCALGLIFWELKDQYDRSQLVPLPSREKGSEMERLLSSLNYTIGTKRKFVDLVLGFPGFYWSYYHKANYCTLQNSIWPNDYSTCRGTVVHLVPCREELIFLDVPGEVEIERLPWHRIRSLTMKNMPIMSLDIEIILVIRGQCIPHFISVMTDCNKFLFSVSLFMLRILQSRDMSNHVLPPLDPFIAEYIQLQTEPDESRKRVILCSGEVAATDFDTLDLLDDETEKKFRNRYCFRGPIYFKSKSQYSYWKAYSDSSEEDDENGSKCADDKEGYGKDEKIMDELHALENLNIQSLFDESVRASAADDGNYDGPRPCEEKVDTADVYYEDVSESDFDYDNSADDELTEDEVEQEKSKPINSDIEDDNVFYANSEFNMENGSTWT